MKHINRCLPFPGKRIRSFLPLLFLLLTLALCAPAALGASVPYVATDVSVPSDNCVLLGIEGKYVVARDAALKRLNEIRLEACTAGVINPETGKPLTKEDYVPLLWSGDMEYIARIRAAEAAVTMNHVRTNGRGCFALCSPAGVYADSEVLAWNYGTSMLTGIEQWYSEKSGWVNQNQLAETGHYEAMINPMNRYVGMAAFCSPDATFYNSTSGEFSRSRSLSQAAISGQGSCVQVIEVLKALLNRELVIEGKTSVKPSLSGKAGAASQLIATTGVSLNDYWGNKVTTHGLEILSGLTWDSSDTRKVSVSSSGLVRAIFCGSSKITVKDAQGSSASVTYTVSHTETADKAVPATCTATGLTAGSHCSVCSAVLTAQKKTAKLSHSWDKGKESKEATVFAAGEKTYTCTVCSQKKTEQTAKLKPTWKVNAASLTLKKGQSTDKLRITSLAKGDSIRSWSSSNAKIAAVSGKGVIQGVKVGTAVITAALASGKKIDIKVKVQSKAVAVSSITNVPKTALLSKGKTLALRPVILPITAAYKPAFKTSNKKVATVSSAGIVRAVGAGRAVITVKAGKKSWKLTVTVPKTATKAITNVPSACTIKKGKTLKLAPVVLPAGSDDKLQYKTSKKSVVSVSSKGKLTARKKGTAVITVISGKIRVSCKVTVN